RVAGEYDGADLRPRVCRDREPGAIEAMRQRERAQRVDCRGADHGCTTTGTPPFSSYQVSGSMPFSPTFDANTAASLYLLASSSQTYSASMIAPPAPALARLSTP